jgi:hypothetical protein
MSFAGLKNSFRLGAIFALAAASSVSASTLRLAWTASASPDVVEYRVHVGTSPGQYLTSYSAGNVSSFSVSNLIGGTLYHFAVSAVNRAGLESDLSTPVSGLAPAVGPEVAGIMTETGSFEVRVAGNPLAPYIVEKSEDLRQWTEVVNAASDSQGRLVLKTQADRPRSFFRVRPQ